MNAPQAVPAVDISACDREPIHLPGTIQSHGALIALRAPSFTAFQASGNANEWFGVGAGTLLGRRIEEILPVEAAQRVLAALAQPDLRTVNPLRLTLGAVGQGRSVNGVLSRQGDVVLLEVEPRSADAESQGVVDLFAQVRMALTRFREADGLAELCAAAAAEVRRFTGFDRVMVYRFGEDWHGEVLGESLAQGVDSFLGLHFPASDIPSQARALYEKSWLRLIPDASSRAVPLLALPKHPEPLDLSFAVLRSVSPVHLEYLRNMNVRASMSISILKGERLWGLVACHHRTPRWVSYDVRSACEFLGSLLSSEVSARDARNQAQAQAAFGAIQSQLIQRMAQDPDFLSALCRDQSPSLADLAKASGAVVWLDEQRSVTVGKVPSAERLRALIAWLTQHVGEKPLHTASLSALYPPAAAFSDVASGLLAVPLSTPPSQWALWFREEVVRNITWAGNPTKLQARENSNLLGPRTSFAAWTESVSGTCAPWRPEEVESALGFRAAMTGVVLRQAAEMARLNAKLAHSNEELDAFTSIASHDLKEPLRGIQNYSRFIVEDAGDKLDAETRDRVELIGRLGGRMQELLDGLYEFSRIGRIELAVKPVDLGLLLEDILTTLRARLEETGVQVRVPRKLPTVRCDEIRLRAVLANLISNAAKYNDKKERWVEVGFDQCVAPGQTEPTFTLYVRDNGIGIPARHQANVFEMFRRLHGHDEFGGGSGVGLAIVQRIVQRHGGGVWMESRMGEGTTFYFTLGQLEIPERITGPARPPSEPLTG